MICFGSKTKNKGDPETGPFTTFVSSDIIKARFQSEVCHGKQQVENFISDAPISGAHR